MIKWETIRQHLLFVSVPVVLSIFLSITYSTTHRYGTIPGLFLTMADLVYANGHSYLATIPNYIPDGGVLAHPPLGTYVLAVLHDLMGITFRWHLGAGGGTRGLAFLLALARVLGSLVLFRDERSSRRWIAFTGLAFGLTSLTHPEYATFAAVSVFTMWSDYDRTWIGFHRGALVVLAGGAVSAETGLSCSHSQPGAGLRNRWPAAPIRPLRHLFTWQRRRVV